MVSAMTRETHTTSQYLCHVRNRHHHFFFLHYPNTTRNVLPIYSDSLTVQRLETERARARLTAPYVLSRSLPEAATKRVSSHWSYATSTIRDPSRPNRYRKPREKHTSRQKHAPDPGVVPQSA